MVDKDGFRPNVGIIIFNDAGRLLWAKRVGQEAWQFPQGGIQAGEEPAQAVIRELKEEVGLDPGDVEIVAATQGWLSYRLPSHLVRQSFSPVCIGQKQKWFLLRLVSDPDKISFEHSPKPEFDRWRWVDYWDPLEQVIAFKREVYRQALEELLAPLNQTLAPGQRIAALNSGRDSIKDDIKNGSRKSANKGAPSSGFR